MLYPKAIQKSNHSLKWNKELDSEASERQWCDEE